MKKSIIISAILLAGISAQAQNLNPVVEVTNEYESSFSGVMKPDQKFAVPDSLYRFDSDFGYTVFNNPYKGGYDFSPYLVDMQPSPAAAAGNKFYLKVGAGYPLRPYADLIFSPKMKNDHWELNVYGMHRSYWGKYYNIMASYDNDLVTLKKAGSGDEKGHDSMSKAGVNGRYNWSGGEAYFDVYYYGLHTDDYWDYSTTSDASYISSYNSANVTLGARSKTNKYSYFFYDGRVDYSYGADRSLSTENKYETLSINDVKASVTAGPMRGGNALLLTLGGQYSHYGNYISASDGLAFAKLNYNLHKGRLGLSLGAKVSVPFSSCSSNNEVFNDMKVSKGQIIYPDVRADYEIVPGRLDVYASVTGGDKVWTYRDFKNRNHHFTLSNTKENLLLNSVERVNAAIGLRGNIKSNFRFDIKGGYAINKDGLMDAVEYYELPAYNADLTMQTYLNTLDYGILYGILKFAYDSQRFIIDGTLNGGYPNVKSSEVKVISPAKFFGDVRARYNVKNRLYFGPYANFSTARRGRIWDYSDEGELKVLVPGYVDLGLSGEFVLNKQFSVWARVGNLLNSTIQLTPLYAEKGINFNAGIILNL